MIVEFSGSSFLQSTVSHTDRPPAEAREDSGTGKAPGQCPELSLRSASLVQPTPLSTDKLCLGRVAPARSSFWIRQGTAGKNPTCPLIHPDHGEASSSQSLKKSCTGSQTLTPESYSNLPGDLHGEAPRHSRSQ